MSDDNAEIDFSVIAKSIKCGGSMVEQIINGVHYGTSEVRCLLLDESDLIIECKVCRNLFRSLPNFVAHKRVYCLDAFQDSNEGTVPVVQASHTDVVVVQPEAPKEDDEVEVPGDGPGATANDVDDADENICNSDTRPTNTMDMTIKQMQEGTFKGTSEAFKFYTQVADKAERNQMNSQTHCLRQDKIPGNPNAVRISVLDSSDADMEVDESLFEVSETAIVCQVEVQDPGPSTEHFEEMPSLRSARLRERNALEQKPEDKHTESSTRKVPTNVSTEIRPKDSSCVQPRVSARIQHKPSLKVQRNLRDRAKNMFLYPVRKTALDSKDCNLKTKTCLICKIKYCNTKSLRYHMRSHHGETRRVFPCPKCTTKFMHMWGLTRHLKRTHCLSKSQIDRMRNKLKSLAYDQATSFSHGSPEQSQTKDKEEVNNKNSPKKSTPVVEKSSSKKSPQSRHVKSNSTDIASSAAPAIIDAKRSAGNNLARVFQRREEHKKALALDNNVAEKSQKDFSVKNLSKTVKKSPQFASGLSLVHCQVCGKAFAKKESLAVHSLVCNEASTEKPQSTTEALTSRRASNRRRQMSPTKIDRSSSAVQKRGFLEARRSIPQSSPEPNEKESQKNAEATNPGADIAPLPVNEDDLTFQIEAPSSPTSVDRPETDSAKQRSTVRQYVESEKESKNNAEAKNPGVDFAPMQVKENDLKFHFEVPSSSMSVDKPETDSAKQRSVVRRHVESEVTVNATKDSATALLDKRSNGPELRRTRARLPSTDSISECSTVSSDVADEITTSVPRRRSLPRRHNSPDKTTEMSKMDNSKIAVLPKRHSLRRGTSPAKPVAAPANLRSDKSSSPNKRKVGSSQTSSPIEVVDNEANDVVSDKSEDSRRTRSLSRRQSTPQNIARSAEDPGYGSGRPTSQNGIHTASARSENTDTRKSADPSDLVEISDEDLLQLKLRTEAQLKQHISDISKDLRAVNTSASSNDQVRCVEEIWIGKSPGKPTERLKSNRIYVVNPKLNKKGRPSCQDTKNINALVDENNLKCYHCGDAFASVSNIRRHAIRHLGWRRYSCKICTYCSYHKSEMKSHLVRVHDSFVTPLTGNSLNLCITDLSREAARLRSNKRRQTISRRIAFGDGSSGNRSTSPARTETEPKTKTEHRKKPAVSETNIVESNQRKFNISTRQSPRDFDVRPFKTVDTMQTLLTRKGLYPKRSATPAASSTATCSSEKSDEATSSGEPEGNQSRSSTPVSEHRAKTRSIDFRKTRNLDNPWVDGFYKHLSGGTLGALRKDQGFHSFRNLGRSSLGSYSTNSTRAGGMATRNRSLNSSTVSTPSVKPAETTAQKETAPSS